MDSVTMVALVVGVALVALVGWYLWQRRRTTELRARYGREYDRAVSDIGDRRRAEAELVRRQERVEHLEIRALGAEQRSGYLQRWHAVQARFVDDPRGAVTDADHLVEDVMMARGYPVADFDQRAADLSVHHPSVVSNYRSAREIAQRHRRGQASTEDLRQAMVYYRELFEDLLEDREGAGARAAERGGRRERTEQSVERAVERDDDRPEATARRGNERTISTDREVRP